MSALAQDTAAANDAALSVEPVVGPAALRRFLKMPASLYRDDPNWIPPLLFERRMHLDPRKNPFFDKAEVAYWLVCRDGHPVGRISAQVNRAHLDRYRDATGHFGFLEAEDDPEVFGLLLATAEDWLRQRGMTRILGPFSLSINDESGLLVDGFERPPYVMMNHAPPYYATRLEAEGYRKAKDLIAYLCAAEVALPRSARALLAKAEKDLSLRVRNIDMGRFREEIATVVDIFNDAWSQNWGFLPFSEGEVGHMAENLKPILSPGAVAIAEVDGEPAGQAGAADCADAGRGAFPFLRRRGPLAILGLSTALPTPPGSAAGALGDRQLDRLATNLEALGREGLFRCVLLHHPPQDNGISRRKRLIDAEGFRAVLSEAGAELVLHGHDHDFNDVRLAGPRGPIPVFGVPSASASLGHRRPGAHYQIYGIERATACWRIRILTRGLRPDGIGFVEAAARSVEVTA